MSVPALRASSAANVVFGVLIASSAVTRLVAEDPATAASAAWPGLAGAVVGLFGLLGLYLAHRDHLGRWAAPAFVAATTGLALSVGQLYGLTFTEPGEGPLGPLFPLGYGPFLVGFLLLDLLLLRSPRVSRVAPSCLIAGALLNAAGVATPEVRLVGVVVFGVGIAWLGYAALAQSLAPSGTAGGAALPRQRAARRSRESAPSATA